LRFEYSPAVSIGEGFWAHQLYVAFTTVPSVHIGSHKPFDNGSFQFKIRRASIIDVTAGLQTNWEYGPKIFGAETYGGYNFGLRYSRSWSTLNKLETPEPEFTEEKNFDRTDNAFGFDLGYRAWLQWDNGFWAGIRGGVAPIYTDFLNHGRSWEAQSNVTVFAGYSWR
jgi:hypothetical protein